MSVTQFPKSPNRVDPLLPSAVASRTSLAWEGRDKSGESKKIIDETTRYITERVITKLSPEVAKDVDVMASIEDKIYNYVNQSYVNMFNRYAVTVEDEMTKKVRDFVDKEEAKSLARYTPKEIVELLDKIGGSDKFNTGEMEKSVVNIYGHLQGHIQRSVNDVENETNALLRQKTDVGAFIRGENAYSIAKCAFKDNNVKPKTVTDIKISINVLESELISPIHHYNVAIEYLMKKQFASYVSELIEEEVEELKEELMHTGEADLTETEVGFEKIKSMERIVDESSSNPKQKRYLVPAKKFLTRIEEISSEIGTQLSSERDPLHMYEQIKDVLDLERIRNAGYNTVLNTLCSILDTSKLGYQYCENSKNARQAEIREYEDSDIENLPDERYAIRVAYYDDEQLLEKRRNYDNRVAAFLREVDAIWDLIHVLKERRKRTFLKRKIEDFEDLAESIMPNDWRAERRDVLSDPDELQWDTLQFKSVENSIIEKTFKTYRSELNNTIDRLNYLKKMLDKMFGFQNPVERLVISERLLLIEKQFHILSYEVNPYHLQSGLILELDLTTTKRKQYVMKAMANVMNEFLHAISQGFSDAAFATFHRRRSTIRSDVDQKFSSSRHSEVDETAPVASPAPKKQIETGSRDAASPAKKSSSSKSSKVAGKSDVSTKSYEEKLKEMGLEEL